MSNKHEKNVERIIYKNIKKHLQEIKYDCSECRFKEKNGLTCLIFGTILKISSTKIERSSGCLMSFSCGGEDDQEYNLSTLRREDKI